MTTKKQSLWAQAAAAARQLRKLRHQTAATSLQLKKLRARIAAKKNAKRAAKLAVKRAAIVKYALSLVGVHEVPNGSNDGPGVHLIQSATGAYRAAWCVSTVQRIWKVVLGSTWANGTAGAYYLESYARQRKATIPHPVPGCAVVYHIGEGHAGTVVAVNKNGTFWAVEGNWGNEVAHVLRNPREIPCTFILRPELR